MYFNAGERVLICLKYNRNYPTRNKSYNKELIKYIKRNIDNLNHHGNYVDLHLIDENDSQELIRLKTQEQILEMPALICANRSGKVYGTPDIKRFLGALCRTKNRISRKSPEEEVLEEQMYCMLTDEGDEIPTDDQGMDLTVKANQFYNRRQEQFEMMNNMNYKQKKAYQAQRNPRNIFMKEHMNRPYNTMNNQSIFGQNYNNQPPPQQEDFQGNRPRNIDMIDDPVRIQQSLAHSDPGGSQDHDLMTKLWINNQETKLSN